MDQFTTIVFYINQKCSIVVFDITIVIETNLCNSAKYDIFQEWKYRNIKKERKNKMVTKYVNIRYKIILIFKFQ